MGFIITLLIICLLVISTYYAFLVIRKKYLDFLSNNSLALKALREVNAKYTFLYYNNYDQEHTYDNENFYNTISCEDFLIYQLQFVKEGFMHDMENEKINKQNYDAYRKEIRSIEYLGNFSSPVDKYNKKILLKLEKSIFEKSKQKPVINLTAIVSLYCSKINGEIYRQKSQIFSSEQILSLIKRINNKNGNFFNDREVWDSICRVERGKVSNKMRFSIYSRDGYRCRICGRSGAFTDLEIDHIKPIAKGGKSTYNNLQTLCKRCNMEKGDKY